MNPFTAPKELLSISLHFTLFFFTYPINPSLHFTLPFTSTTHISSLHLPSLFTFYRLHFPHCFALSWPSFVIWLACCGMWKFHCTVHRRSCLELNLELTEPTSHPFSLRAIVLPSISRSPFRFGDKNLSHIFHFPHVCCVCLTHFILFAHTPG